MNDRAEMKAARDAGKAIHQAQRLENATYTAVEVKALTKQASDLAYALGRRETAEEIALVIEAYHGEPCTDGCDDCKVLADLARLAREIGTKEAERPTHPGMHPLEATCNEACWNKRDHP